MDWRGLPDCGVFFIGPLETKDFERNVLHFTLTCRGRDTNRFSLCVASHLIALYRRANSSAKVTLDPSTPCSLAGLWERPVYIATTRYYDSKVFGVRGCLRFAVSWHPPVVTPSVCCLYPQHEHISRVSFLVCLSVFACTPVHSKTPTTSTDTLACFAGALTKHLVGLICGRKTCASRLFDPDTAHACSTVVAEQGCIAG